MIILRDKLSTGKKISDEELFKQPTAEDCPIFFLRMPTLNTGRRYQTCCGKMICSGCFHAPVYDDQGNEVDNQKCPYCRTPTPYSEREANERSKKRVEAGDVVAIHNLGVYYHHGRYGLAQDYSKALEFFHRAGELGMLEHIAILVMHMILVKGWKWIRRRRSIIMN